MKGLVAVWLALCLVWGCATPSPRLAGNPRTEPTRDGLHPLDHGGFGLVWVRPGVDLDAYRRFDSSYREILYRAATPETGRPRIGGLRASRYALPPGMQADLEQALERIFDTELERDGGWELTREQAAGVLGVRVTVQDVMIHTPLSSYAGDDLRWVSSVGEMTLVIEVHDNGTGDRLLLAAERRSISSVGKSPPRATVGQARYEVLRLFREWAAALRHLLLALRDVRWEPPAGDEARSPQQLDAAERSPPEPPVGADPGPDPGGR